LAIRRALPTTRWGTRIADGMKWKPDASASSKVVPDRRLGHVGVPIPPD
jgi:hypothetical protein